MPKVSVIVPNFNHAPFLKQRINSILDQSFQDFELILLDDLSTDNSVDILLEFTAHPKVSHVVLNKENSGSTFRQWKKGIELSIGDLIWIAESDDWASPEFLERLVAPFNNNKDLGIAYSESFVVTEEGVGDLTFSQKFYSGFFDVMKESLFSGSHFVEQFLLFENVIPNVSAALIRRDLFSQYLNGVEEVKTCGDWLFYLKCLGSHNVFFTPEPLNYFRRHIGSVIGSTKLPACYYQSILRYKYDVFLKGTENSLLKEKNQALYYEEVGRMGIYKIRVKKNVFGLKEIMMASYHIRSLKYFGLIFQGIKVNKIFGLKDALV